MSEPEARIVHGEGHCASFSLSQVPSKTDEDKFCCQLSHEAENLPFVSSFGIFDGHGGDYASKKCSMNLHSRILKKYCELANNVEGHSSDATTMEFVDELFCEAVRHCTEEIDLQIRRKSLAGTTQVSLFLIDRPDGSTRVICPWIGDSTCVMFRPDNGKAKLYQMTQDHKPNLRREHDRIHNKVDCVWGNVPHEVTECSFKDRDKDPHDVTMRLSSQKSSGDVGLEGITIDVELTHQESFIKRRQLDGCSNSKGPIAVFGRYNISLCMTRSIGDRYGPRSCIAVPDITGVTIAPNEFGRFVMASDGLWDVINFETLSSIILTFPDAKRAAKKLSVLAWHKRMVKSMRMDDITVIVVDVHPNNFVAASANCSCAIS